MNKNLLIGVGAVVIFIIGALGGNYANKLFQPDPEEASQQNKGLIGTPLPQFSLLGLDGVREHIGQWSGQVQVINFWATWCPPCKREIPALIELQNRYGPQGVQVIGIALDKKEKVLDYVKANNINYPILIGDDDVIDVSTQLGNELGVLPYTVIVDRLGNIGYVRYGEIDQATIEIEIKKLL